MWRLFLSGLFCVPALLLLIASAPGDGASRVRHVFAASPVTAAPASPITVSLPPSQFPGRSIATDLEVASAEKSATAPAAQEQAPPHPKLYARAVVRHDGGPTLVGRSAPKQPQESLWASIGRWFTQHEAPKAWSPSPGGGTG